MAEYTNTFYGGSPSSLSPEFGSDYLSNVRYPISKLSVTTNPRSANIIQEVSEKLNLGTKNIELTLIEPALFEAVPKQYFKEVHRLTKLTGANVSVHGPLIEPSGISQREGYTEIERNKAERIVAETLERSHDLNPDGNVVVTFHTSNQFPATEVVKKDGKEIVKGLLIVDKESGKLVNFAREDTTHYLETTGEKLEKGEFKSPQDQLRIMNDTKWNEDLTQLSFYKERADNVLRDSYVNIQELYKDLSDGKIDPQNLTPTQREVYGRVEIAGQNLHETQRALNSLFNKAWKYGSDEDKVVLKKVSEQFKKELDAGGKVDLRQQSLALQNVIHDLKKGINPKFYQSLDEYSMEKSTQTYGNAVFENYKKFGDKAAILSIENPPTNQQFSRAKDLKNMIEKSRTQFVERAMKDGYNEDEAKRAAEKLIGATWDVGHINMLRRHGFDEKDVIAEAKTIKPFLKHVHLSDNFGGEHIELPMGMGNVPLKEIMKEWGEQGEKATKVFEQGSMFQFHGAKAFPFKESITGVGSPFFAGTDAMPSYWNQSAGFTPNYFEGYGQMLPPKHLEMYGTGFLNLPTEMGGTIPGNRGSRFAGNPME